MNLLGLYEILYKHYGPQGWWPLFDRSTGECEYHGDYTVGLFQSQRRFEVCAGSILTQNTNWKNVVKALAGIYGNNAMDPNVMLELGEGALSQLIRPSGFFNAKAKKLITFCDFYLELGERTPTREELLELHGVGEETADSILLYAYGEPQFVCDAYTRRLMSRLGFADENVGYEALKQMFESELSPAGRIPFSMVILWREFHALIVRHCTWVCNKKPLCPNCVLEDECAYVSGGERSVAPA